MPTLSSISPGAIGARDVAAVLACAAAPARKPGPTVLLVDDDSSVRNSLCRVLTTEGLRVVPARGVKDALDYLTLNTPDPVITDLCMALLSGWDLIAHLGNRYPELPIVVITALPVQSAFGADQVATAFFQKPLDVDALLAAIWREFDWSRPSQGSAFVR